MKVYEFLANEATSPYFIKRKWSFNKEHNTNSCGGERPSTVACKDLDYWIQLKPDYMKV
jgi:hypothetical protein